MLFNLWDQKKVQKQNNDNMFNTETMLPVSEIRDNTIILKDTWIRAILEVTGLNLDYKNFEEIQIVLEQYKRFLNGLDFPIQIVVRNNYLDLSDYLNYIDNNIDNIINPVLKEQWESYYNFLQDIDNRQWMIYTKKFYIIVPYYPWEWDKSQIKTSWLTKFFNALNTKDSVEQIVARHRTFLKWKNMLDNRCDLIASWLQAIWLPTTKIGTSDIISLLFSFYNPTVHTSQAELA